MAQSNRERVGKALEILNTGLKPLVGSQAGPSSVNEVRSVCLKTGESSLLGVEDLEDFGEPEQFDDFEDAFGKAEQSDIAVVLPGLFGEGDQRAQSRAADVIQIAAIKDHSVLILTEE